MTMKTEVVEWIAVEDRLPESHYDCWITLDPGTDDNRVQVSKGYYRGRWYWADNLEPIALHEGVVIAWAPID